MLQDGVIVATHREAFFQSLHCSIINQMVVVKGEAVFVTSSAGRELVTRIPQGCSGMAMCEEPLAQGHCPFKTSVTQSPS